MEVESIVDQGASVKGGLVVGRVLEIEELTGFKKPIRFCRVDVGNPAPQEIVCGAQNFAVGDLVVVILPGGELPGGFKIGARKTYGRNSNGMITSVRELGLGDEHAGILVLPPDAGTPGQDARPVVGLDDVLIDVEITPDRGYEMSLRGMARELSYVYESAYTDPAAIEAPGGTAEPPYPLRVDDTVGCDRFAARVVRGIDPAAPVAGVDAAPAVQAGIRSISLPVDITNYVMLEMGQPMHVFDLNLLRGGLVVRRATPGEKLTTLDGVARVLDAEDMVICDDSGPISLAAVMGGETSEVAAGDGGRAARGGALGPDHGGSHGPPAQAVQRGRQAVGARGRPAAAAGRAATCGGPPGRARRRHGGRAGARHRQRGTAGADRGSTRSCPPGGSAWRIPTRRGRAAEQDRLLGLRGRSRSPRRPGGPTCSPRPTWSRRSRGSAATTTSPASFRSRPAVAVSPRCSAAAGRWGARWPRPGMSRCCRTRSSPPRCTTRSGCPRTTPGATRSG